jgi:hypothetical protein
MAKACFCGCGRDVPFGRRRLTNSVGAQVSKDLALFEGALERAPDPEHDAALRGLVAEGPKHVEQLRGVIHGTRDRGQLDRDGIRAWLDRAGDHRLRLAKQAIEGDYAGWSAHDQAQLLLTGVRAPAEIVDVEDTGMTVNNSPRVRVRLRVRRESGEPFELERRVVVSRVSIPRRGERVEVAYDPDDPTEFTFRLADLADDPAAGHAPDRVGQLAKLAELHEKGLLTREEFEAEKERLLQA